MTTEATPGELGSNDQLGPVAWALTAFGRVQKIVMRADVADELACKWRESDPEATAVPLYSWATVEAERSRYAPVMQAVEWLLNDGHMNQEHLARLRAAYERA